MGCAHRLQEVIMKRIQDIIEEQIKNAFVGAGYDAEYGKVGISNNRIYASTSATEQWLLQSNIIKRRL